jgi:hypothetical protein
MDAFDLIEQSRDSLLDNLRQEDDLAYGDDAVSFESEAAGKKHPLLQSKHTSIYRGLSMFFMFMSITAIVLGTITYFQAKQLRNDYDRADLSLIGGLTPDGKINGTFANSCYTCAEGPVYDDKGHYMKQDIRLTFNGQMRLTDTQREKIQFPNGIIIAGFFTIRGQNTKSDLKASYVAPAGFTTGYANMGPGARISTWNQFNADPQSPFSLVPGVLEVLSSGRTVTCSASGDSKVYDGGPIFGAFNSSNAMAACTCTTITGQTAEFCIGLQDPAP